MATDAKMLKTYENNVQQKIDILCSILFSRSFFIREIYYTYEFVDLNLIQIKL